MDAILYAFLLLTSPSEPALTPSQLWLMREPICSVAVALEVMDERERKFMLTKFDETPNDLDLLRRRWVELKDAPPLADSWRFPSRELVNDLLVFNRAYHKFLEERQPVDAVHGNELRKIIRETDQLYQVWDAVRDARCEYYYTTVRRQALKRLRELLGDEAYTAGKLPPHVPLWRFEEIDK